MSIALAWMSGAFAAASVGVLIIDGSKPWATGCGLASVALLVLGVLARIAPNA